jgi:transposase/ribosomal protein S15P/S13E
MTRDEATAILDLPRPKAVKAILALAEKAEKYDDLTKEVSPTTPSGMTPPYLKPSAAKRKKKSGRKKGHKGASRPRPEKVDHFKEHTLENCPGCQTPLNEPVGDYQRYTEDIPRIEKPQVTQHTVYRYWCPTCKKIVSPTVPHALPRANIGLRLVVFTAWLHYLVGVSVNNIVRLLSVVCHFHISPGGLTQAWCNLACLLEPVYIEIGQKVSHSAVLHADETGWRLNGITHWLWGFSTKSLCYYLITKGRGSPVVKEVLDTIYKGILICDFWGAYNKITTLAKQRCFYHLFTELAKVDRRNSSTEWNAFRKKFTRLLKDAIRLSDRKPEFQQAVYGRRKARLADRLEAFFKINPQDKDVKRLIKRLKRHRNELFTFLDYENVSPYNNHAEQQMRKPVLTRKVSQQNRSEQGAKTQAIMMSLFRSAELQQNNPVETILAMSKSILANTRDQISDDYFKLAA